MSTSDTHTTAASAALARLRNAASESENGSTDPGIADGSGLATAAKASPAQHAPAVPPAPSTNLPPTEQVSERIGHPVPRHHEKDPQDLDELLHPAHPQPRSGSPFRHMDGEAGSGADPAAPKKATARAAAIPPKPSTAPKPPAAPLGTAAPSMPATPAGASEPAAVSGGFPTVNNWLDSLPEPEWQRIGDKIYASPARFKARLVRARAERARAVEARERTRLMDAAHAEALAEAAQRAEAEHAARFRAEQELAERQLLEEERQERLLEQHRLEQQRLEQQRVAPIPDPNTMALPAAAQPAPTRVPASADELAALVASAKAAIDRQQALAEPLYVAPYTLPDTAPDPEATAQDKIRRTLFTIAAAIMVVASILGTGALVSGSVTGHDTLLSLAPVAYTLVPVISFWALAASLFAWHPSQISAVRQRAVGRTFPTALAASALWLVSVNAGSLFLAFGAATLTAGLLLVTVRELNSHTARNTTERMLTDAPAGLMAGFFLVVSAAAFAELLHSWNVFVFPDVFASLIVLGLGYVAIGMSRTERGRIELAAGFAWGMLWLLAPRLVGPDRSVWVAVLAAVAGFVVLVATENRRYQINHAERRAARGKRTVY
ncbi:hypothetical protein ACFY5D_13945 [Paeniglutamicibacter sp. NPDC012692]|uniref:hypothetical protein n=1 Tax=Paeniglutamicibacter sp. NPDC012692 TaxID=3364388 RepID=UPI00367E6D2A